jgi:hypothetical protein
VGYHEDGPAPHQQSQGVQHRLLRACTIWMAKSGTVMVHRPTGTTAKVTALEPVTQVGWVLTDDATGRVAFGVIHSSVAGGNHESYVIDTEVGDLATGQVRRLVDQVTPSAVLSDGRILVTSAPQRFDEQEQAISIITVGSGAPTLRQLGPAGVYLVGVLDKP